MDKSTRIRQLFIVRSLIISYTVKDMSSGLKLFIGIFVILLIAALFVFLIYYKGLSNAVFVYCFKRTEPEKWRRGCSNASDKKLYQMWQEGCEWEERNKFALKEISISNGGLILSAKYFDFGFKEAVIIIPGMFESSSYSQYYAPIYKECGYNCLLIDNRATGNSEGTYNTIGFFESLDVIEWSLYLNEKYDVKKILLHGISTGARTVLMALEDKSCPPFIVGAICDEAYLRFDDFFKNYMISKKYNTLVHKSVMKKIMRTTGADPYQTSVKSSMDEINVPILFFAGENDDLISKEETNEMFDHTITSAKAKKIVWFENGKHGFLRSSDPEKYDEAIKNFISELK